MPTPPCILMERARPFSSADLHAEGVATSYIYINERGVAVSSTCVNGERWSPSSFISNEEGAHEHYIIRVYHS